MKPPSSAPKPTRIGKYDVLDVLGRGGMGVVYRARDSRLGRIVAIKMLTEGFSGAPDMLRRFYEEANRHAALHHNNIVVVFDAGDQDGEPYLVMEFVEGEGLDKLIKEQGRMRPETAANIVEQVCHALAYAHRKGLIHRDVKPANVIVQRNGIAKLLDFGIARDDSRTDQTLTNTGALVGTPPYMAPERFQGALVDGRSDIFSTGVLFYQMITGALPFDADYPAVIEQILRFHPPAPSELIADCPKSLDAIVSHALAKSPFDRYPNADDMAMDLHEVIEGITRARIDELMTEAEAHFNQSEFNAAQTALRSLLRMDGQHVAGRRLLSLVEQRLTEQARARRTQDLVRQAQQASAERDWDRALGFCDEAIELSPATPTLVELHKSLVENKQTQGRVSQLLQESAIARRNGELTRAQTHAASAYRLDPLNSQILALCKVLEQEIQEKQRKEELRIKLAEAKEHLAAREFEEAALLLNQADALSPDNAEVFRLRDQLATLLLEDRRRFTVRKLEERAAITTSIEKLRVLALDLANALREFPNDPSLLRLKLGLEPRIKQLEDALFVRDVCKSTAELSPEEALARIREALVRVPANEQLVSLEAALSERITRQERERQLAHWLQEATQAIHDRLYLEAVKILQRAQAEGFASYEIEGLLELAKVEGSKRISQELLERTYSQAKRLIDQEDYESAVQLLRRALQQVDEPVLHRQLEEAAQKQIATTKRAEAALERAGNLVSLELFAEAALLLEEQSAAVKRLPRIVEVLDQAKKLQQAEANFSFLIGRCYAQLGLLQGVDDIRKALKPPAITGPASEELVRERLRQRCEDVYGEKTLVAMATARDLLGKEDSQGAEAVLEEPGRWLDLTSPEMQQELRTLQSEAAGAKKVLRFRRGFRG